MPNVISKKMQRGEVAHPLAGTRTWRACVRLRHGAQWFKVVTMELTLPAQIEHSLTPDEARMGLALGLYVSGKLGFGRAAMVSGVSRPTFQKAMALQRLPMDYTTEDLHEDVEALVRQG